MGTGILSKNFVYYVLFLPHRTGTAHTKNTETKLFISLSFCHVFSPCKAACRKVGKFRNQLMAELDFSDRAVALINSNFELRKANLFVIKLDEKRVLRRPVILLKIS
jgi:hypothetical protein